MSVSLEQLLKFISAEFKETTSILQNPEPNSLILISHFSSYKDCKRGGVSWVNLVRIKEDITSILCFSGSLLIIPRGFEDLQIRFPTEISVVEADKPKLVFSRLVNTFFSDWIESKWISLGTKNSTHPMAKIAASSMLGPGVVIGENVEIASNVSIGPNTVIDNCIIKENTTIGANCTLGLSGFGYDKREDGTFERFPHIGRVIIGSNVEIGSNTCIDRGALGDTVIGSGAKIDNLVHIAHNVELGENVLVIANSMVAGSCVIGEAAWLAPSCSVMNQVVVGAGATLGMGAVIRKNVAAGDVVVGNPGRVIQSRT